MSLLRARFIRTQIKKKLNRAKISKKKQVIRAKSLMKNREITKDTNRIPN